jgi:hypothetical protein
MSTSSVPMLVTSVQQLTILLLKTYSIACYHIPACCIRAIPCSMPLSRYLPPPLPLPQGRGCHVTVTVTSLSLSDMSLTPQVEIGSWAVQLPAWAVQHAPYVRTLCVDRYGHYGRSDAALCISDRAYTVAAGVYAYRWGKRCSYLCRSVPVCAGLCMTSRMLHLACVHDYIPYCWECLPLTMVLEVPVGDTEWYLRYLSVCVSCKRYQRGTVKLSLPVLRSTALLEEQL